MVVFTCNHCGESLKKAAVEKHYSFKSCRNAPIFLTCVDCLKDFKEQEYAEHVKCVTEAERYAAKGTFVAKPEKNKAAQKQELWTECIQELAARPKFDGKTKSMLNRIAAQTNVPRKKPKFVNFVKNCMKYSAHDAECIWQIIEVGLEEFSKKSAPQETADKKPTEPEPKEALTDTTNNNNTIQQNGKTETTETNNTNGNNGSDITLASVIKHAIKQTNTKNTKKALKKLQNIANVPLNIDAPKKKKFTKYLQTQLELDEENAQNVVSAVLESINSLRTNSNGEMNGEEVTSTNGAVGKKRKNPDASNEETASKKAKTNGETNGAVTIDWQKSILQVFNKNQQENRLELDTLKSKVLKKLLKGADNAQTNAHDKKFKKQLKKVNSLQVVGSIVQLKA